MNQDSHKSFASLNVGLVYRVTRAYESSNPDPITLYVGEIFQVSERIDYWNDNPDWAWIWCTDQQGCSGWVAKSVITLSADGTTGTVQCAYIARELTVAVGDELVATQEESGWLWCTDQQGQSGWVPCANVALSES